MGMAAADQHEIAHKRGGAAHQRSPGRGSSKISRTTA
jgi:hypothetical protein